MTAAIEFRGVSRIYGEVRAVDDVSFAIEPGEFFAMLGPSGSGKTTCLRLISGFETPTAGHVRLFGEAAEHMPPNRRSVNTVFQDYALFPHMTVADNVAYGLKIDGVPEPDRSKRVQEALDLVQLGHLGDRMPDQLSGGQRQRVALARALVKKPKVLLLDEPLSALDAKLREAMRFELSQLQRKVGITFIMVTHDQDEALAIASRIAVMNKGSIAQLGTPSDLFEFPASRFVADFIGSVNMFEGRLIEDEPAYVRIQCDDLDVPVYVDHGVSSAPGAIVWVAIRPEKVHIGRDKPASPDNWTTAVVRDIAYMGDLSVYLLRLESGKIVRITQPNVFRHAEDRITWDERVYLSWHASSPVPSWMTCGTPPSSTG